MAADQELADDQLPAGHTPVWIEPPRDATQVDMLKKVETMAGEYKDVMVLYCVYRRKSDSKEIDEAAAWCKEKGWKYHSFEEIYGCEAECVVLLNSSTSLRPELITRGINRLIIVSTERYYSNMLPSLCLFLSLKIFQRI